MHNHEIPWNTSDEKIEKTLFHLLLNGKTASWSYPFRHKLSQRNPWKHSILNSEGNGYFPSCLDIQVIVKPTTVSTLAS